MSMIGRKIHIHGIVQGVGFRPFIYSQALNYHITGWVRNSSAGVDIIANGKLEDIENFINQMKQHPPPLSRLDTFVVHDIHPDGFDDFKIIESTSELQEFVPVSPDVSICEDCTKELFDPKDRRYRYPFINCTNCGPRFTIIKEIPYDRPKTTMVKFEMCEPCKKEYKDPLNRRFHAQPIACPKCGPRIWFQDHHSQKVVGDAGLQLARSWIMNGKIIAVKGIGGFHLACDAKNENAIKELRKRKKRTDKAFALMVFNTETALKYCKMDDAEISILESREKPILIVDRKENNILPASIAPNTKTLGVMLPYTPLHLLLLFPEPGFTDALIMTSGNIVEEPIAYTNESAFSKLIDIADAFLLNNRDIHMRVDDSVLKMIEGKSYFYRRSRGFAPNPILITQPLHEVLAVGAELKSTFCLTKGNYAFISHHIGDLENNETFVSFEQGIHHYQKLFRVNPKIIAHDLHPDYLSTQYAINKANNENIRLIPIQHHHAHLASCLIDNQRFTDKPVIGAILDGTGFGSDGKIWGGEFLVGGLKTFVRSAHLSYLPLPGVESAIKNPRKIAAAYLWKTGIEWKSDLPVIKSFNSEELSILKTQLEREINCVWTSSAGRLFDAVASLIGIRHFINYEAQAAIELENIADPAISDLYEFDTSGLAIDPVPVIKGIVNDLRRKFPISTISAKFHNGLVEMILNVCGKIKREYNLDTIVLSGGVWQNQYLLLKSISKLESAGFTVLFHHQVPTNDGGISLGQALIANHLLNMK